MQVILESYNPRGATNGFPREEPAPRPELLLFSAASETALAEVMRRHREYVGAHPEAVADAAYTLAVRRERLPHRAFVVARDGVFVDGTGTGTGAILAPAQPPAVTLVFSGQGAQWPEMGRELILSDMRFRKDMSAMDRVLQGLAHPPAWSIIGRCPPIMTPCFVSGGAR